MLSAQSKSLTAPKKRAAKGVRGFELLALAFATLALSAAALPGQQPEEVPSLGTIARKLKAERAGQAGPPPRVYTNDSLHLSPAPQAESPKAAAPSKAEQAATTPSKQPEEHGEKYFRARADKIRSRLELHRRQLAVLQQQLSLASTEFYSDPQKTLQQESTPTFHGDVNKLRDRIERTKQQIAGDEKAMEDLREELRRDGGDPGWIRQ